MSLANLLPPSAPPAGPLYLVVAEPSQNFHLQKVNEISNTLGVEVHHYRLFAKKYKRARKFVNWGAAGSSVLSAAFSSASFGSALSVVGQPAAIPLGGAGGCFALVSLGLIITSKKLNSKIKKHQEITTLAVAKRDTVNRLLSNTLNNNEVSSHEFDTILSESQQYNFLKDQVRARMLRQPSKRGLAEVDVKKMEKDIRGRLEAEMIKKITNPPASN